MAESTDWRLDGTFAKRDDERHLVFGWAYVADDDGQVSVDHSGDFVDKAALGDLEDAAYDYVLNSREADDMHERFDSIAKIVEAVMVTPEKLDAMGLRGTRTGFWVGFKVFDEDVWKKIKSGERPGFSIRGTGIREPVNA